MLKIEDVLAKELGVKPSQVEAVIKLIDEGNTIPFIARYRKEATEAWTMPSCANSMPASPTCAPLRHARQRCSPASTSRAS